MSDDIDALRAAARMATRERMAAQNERDEFKNAHLREIEVKANEIYQARIAEAVKRETDARATLREAEARKGLDDNADMYKGLLFEWGHERHGFGFASSPKKKTGRVGKYEVCTPQSTFSANKIYCRPSSGERFIRILKKDGSPSLDFVREYRSNGWLPEGKTPEVAA